MCARNSGRGATMDQGPSPLPKLLDHVAALLEFDQAQWGEQVAKLGLTAVEQRQLLEMLKRAGQADDFLAAPGQAPFESAPTVEAADDLSPPLAGHPRQI